MAVRTRDQVLSLLKNHQNTYISGEEIAQAMQISRAAVWKAIQALKQTGYDIAAMTNRGYFLKNTSALLSVQNILPHLAQDTWAEKIKIFSSLPSTSVTLKEMAIHDAPHGVVVLADTQTAGRGRYGRYFYSPAGSGLYMSVLLRPISLYARETALLTAAAAVAVCLAIRKVCAKETQIKWVNDILLNGKKVGGILTEAMTHCESGQVDWVVLGIGINIGTDKFPDTCSANAGSLFHAEETNIGETRNRLAAEILNVILSTNWPQLDKKEEMTVIIEEYKRRMPLSGQMITVTKGDKTFDATAMTLDDELRLVVRAADGKLMTLSTEEVSVKASRL